MTSSKFIALCKQCEQILRDSAPVDTGNLRDNGIIMEMLDQDTCRLYVDENIAPYMAATNEPWEHKLIRMGNFKKGETVERFRTWDNPNEGWFDRAAETIINHIINVTQGELHNDNT